MKPIRFGIIGGGLMGRECAGAIARWCQLTEPVARPELVAVCSQPVESLAWFKTNFDTIKQFTLDYQELLANDDVDAVYIAVPHYLHAPMFIAAIEAGKHLMGEKPFGIDRAANAAILAAIGRRPEVFVRCVSQFPFFPAVQRIGQMIEHGALGRIIEVETGFLHSSDLDPNKPVNWKRRAETNGAYGVMGDLGMHACHVPIRAGWAPRNVRAVLRNLIAERPESDDSAVKVPCDTWDNATLLIEAEDPRQGERFPWLLRMFRIAPGERNSWYLRILGTKSSVRFNTRQAGCLELMEYTGGEQNWQQVQVGFQTAYPTVTGPIFEFGFTDAILQMWAAFTHELTARSVPGLFAGCVTPQETSVSHAIFTAALASAASESVQPLAALPAS